MSDTTERYISSKASHNDSDETASDEEEKNIVSHSDLLESETGLFHIYNVTRWYSLSNQADSFCPNARGRCCGELIELRKESLACFLQA